MFLEQLALKGELTIFEANKAKIAEIRKYSGRVKVCSGCTYSAEEPLHTLFRENHGLYVAAIYRFEANYDEQYQ